MEGITENVAVSDSSPITAIDFPILRTKLKYKIKQNKEEE